MSVGRNSAAYSADPAIELFARHVLPRFEERNAWRSQSMDWRRANREGFSAKRKAAAASAVERHCAEPASKNREAEK